eukprot:6252410-Karenia_brevis.AAC.1
MEMKESEEQQQQMFNKTCESFVTEMAKFQADSEFADQEMFADLFGSGFDDSSYGVNLATVKPGTYVQAKDIVPAM